MQKPNEKKRRKIIETAARLFATRSFHEVRLDDVAAGAHVGKGTLYIYFKNKEELYVSLVRSAFARLVEELESREGVELPPRQSLRRIVRRVVMFAFSHPESFELSRNVPEHERRDLIALRMRLTRLIADALRRGIRQGIWTDPRPRLTAVFIPGIVRSAMLYGPGHGAPRVLSNHILRLLERGLDKRKSE